MIEPPTAAVLLIGDELLSGKVRDQNGFFLARALRKHGVRLVELAVVGDDVEEITSALRRLAARARIVISAGGVGPTHDDRTLSAVSLATGCPLQRFAEMEQLLRGHYGAELTEHALHMADLPAGTELLGGPGWPVMRVPLGEATLFILPGVPTLVRAKVQALFERGELPTGPGWYLTTLYTSLEESRLAGDLAAVATEFADVQIGSYPNWNRLADGALVHHVRVTFETGQQGAARAEAAKRRFAATLPPEAVIDPRTLDDQ